MDERSSPEGGQRDVREIATGSTTERFLTVAWSGEVSLWSLQSGEALGSFPTTWSFGGRRLALGDDADVPVAVTAAWERHGVCAYNAATGSLLWQRKDVKRVNELSVLRGRDAVTACSGDGPMQVLDLFDGSTLARVRAVRSCYANDPDLPLVGDVHGGLVFVDPDTWQVLNRCRMDGWATIAGAVSRTEALVSGNRNEDGASYSTVSCTDLNGQHRWKWHSPADVLCRRLSWDPVAGSWLGVLHHLERAEEDQLVRWSTSGEVTTVAGLGLAATAEFTRDGALLVLSDGRIVHTSNGTVAAVFG